MPLAFSGVLELIRIKEFQGALDFAPQTSSIRTAL
jgi:hypothetical protein